ncbi:MAG: tRNA guanosine(34) transglycosylase Tgt [Thermoanaerobaculaceae bacterium]|nr:tRNA guanosine(34) transglycosylase Tgt [Thermoanaerobaculaceae bacterium]MDI9620794.1 tRNA guanosine(34) transglycosylase Tgt [Acidobacteriota bacterium]NLH10820.1 tRNA guanosine(34) transglycosylase Tgt [Holophagae bacterium]HPW56219.1 tRNA guanosine(34) transglycosylase Tgt [Thermoanaerobaculaceae bacterium]
MAGHFAVVAEDGGTRARAGELTTRHGIVHTPAFMPVGTAASVKGLAPWELGALGPEMVLCNTYHLLLRPGVETLERLGGLHAFMGWDGPILSDSGGFQVFSLAARRQLDEDGVTFRSHLDGSELRLTPESCIETQRRLGVDVAMALDVCLALPAPRAELEAVVGLTSRWAARCRAALVPGAGTLLFGIVQGGLDLALRRRSAEELGAMGFDGHALGGLSVGEPPPEMWQAVDACAPLLPADRPRYLMGVGTVVDIVHAVTAGIDLFDCVIPTRNARNGLLHTSRGPVVLKHARWRQADEPPDRECTCPTCRTCSLAYLRHLFLAREAAVVVLATVHNLHFYLSLMRCLRSAIMTGRFAATRGALLARFGAADEET